MFSDSVAVARMCGGSSLIAVFVVSCQARHDLLTRSVLTTLNFREKFRGSGSAQGCRKCATVEKPYLAGLASAKAETQITVGG